MPMFKFFRWFEHRSKLFGGNKIFFRQEISQLVS